MKNKFKPGDKLRCINISDSWKNQFFWNKIKVGDIIEVEKTHIWCDSVPCVSIESGSYFMPESCFVKLGEQTSHLPDFL